VTFDIPRADGAGFNGDYFRKREVVVGGIIQKTTASLLNTELDDFKKAMAASEGYLLLKVNDEMRRIVATLQNPQDMFKRREGYHITFTPFDLNFLALEPMFHGLEYTAVTFEDISSLSYPSEVETEGSYKAQPVIVIILQTATAVTAVTFTNDTNGDEITVSATYADGDIITIDSEEKSVTINGVEVDYDGVFPELSIGTNEFTIDVTGSAVLHTSTIKYRKTYL
jgi:phage-related protein